MGFAVGNFCRVPSMPGSSSDCHLAAVPAAWCWQGTPNTVPGLDEKRLAQRSVHTKRNGITAGMAFGTCDMKGFFALAIDASQGVL